MTAVVLVFHLIISVALVGIILVQRSEGGGLGIGGGQGGMGSLASVRGTASFLTRTTAILATIFIITSLTLAILARDTGGPKSILEVQSDAPIGAVEVVEQETVGDEAAGDGTDEEPLDEAPAVPTPE